MSGAAYELALRSSRPYQPGDQVSYYVTGETKRVKVNEAAKLAAEWSPAAPDENTAYYVAKLQRALREVPAAHRAGRPRRPSWRPSPTPAPAVPVQGSLVRPEAARFTRPARAGAGARAPPRGPVVPGAGREADLRGEPRHPALDVFAVARAGHCRGPDRARGSARAPTGTRARTNSRKKRQRHLGSQEERLPDRLARAGREGGGEQLAQARVAVRQQGQHRHEEEARANARRRTASAWPRAADPAAAPGARAAGGARRRARSARRSPTGPSRARCGPGARGRAGRRWTWW